MNARGKKPTQTAFVLCLTRNNKILLESFVKSKILLTGSNNHRKENDYG